MFSLSYRQILKKTLILSTLFLILAPILQRQNLLPSFFFYLQTLLFAFYTLSVPLASLGLFILWIDRKRKAQNAINPSQDPVSQNLEFSPERRFFLSRSLKTSALLVPTTLASSWHLPKLFYPQIIPQSFTFFPPPPFPSSSSSTELLNFSPKKHTTTFTFAQLSDIHLGPFLQEEFAHNLANLLRPLNLDALFITGDVVDGKPEKIHHFLDPLAEIKTSLGTFLVTGNHEYYWDREAWVKVFKSKGMQVLENTSVLVQKEGAFLGILGVEDYRMGRHYAKDSNPVEIAWNHFQKEKEKKSSEFIPTILLAHQPTSYKDAKNFPINLQLSGHTHGGQYFPGTLGIRLFHKFYKGRYELEKNSRYLYVNSGTGFWGPPLRSVPAEITLIQLTYSPRINPGDS